MKIFRVLFAAFFLVLAVISARAFLLSVTDVRVRNFATLDIAEQRAMLGALADSQQSANVNLAAASEAGRGESATEQTGKIDAWCHALEMYGRSLKLDPYDSRTLLNWANIRQLLGTVECPQPYTKGNFGDVAKFALEQDPSNVNNRYIAGLLLFWSGDVSSAAEQFYFVLRFGVGLDELRRNQIFSIVSTPDLLVKSVPARIPQAVQYLTWFQQQSKKGEAWSERLAESGALGNLKKASFEFIQSSIADRALPRSIVLEQIQKLQTISMTVEEQHSLDQLYFKAVDLSEENAFSELLKVRAASGPIAAQLGAIGIDTKVGKTSVTRWGLEQQAVLDSYHSSIAVFTRNGDLPKYFEVNCGYHSSIDLQAEQIQLFLSEDNQLFREVTEEAEVSAVRNGLETIFFIDAHRMVLPSSPKGRYWKIHFNGGSRQGLCRSSLRSMVRVYGSAGATQPGEEL